MGIKGLLKALRPLQRSIHIRAYRNRTVAIDVSTWLHRASQMCIIDLALNFPTTDFTLMIESYLRMLQSHDVTPVMVFDGASPPLKQETQSDRRERREDSIARGFTALATADVQKAEDSFRRAVRITGLMIRQLQRLLTQMGVAFVVAPYEADAQIAFMYRRGLIAAAITEDSDLLPYGCDKVILKIDRDGSASEIDMSRAGLEAFFQQGNPRRLAQLQPVLARLQQQQASIVQPGLHAARSTADSEPPPVETILLSQALGAASVIKQRPTAKRSREAAAAAVVAAAAAAAARSADTDWLDVELVAGGIAGDVSGSSPTLPVESENRSGSGSDNGAMKAFHLLFRNFSHSEAAVKRDADGRTTEETVKPGREKTTGKTRVRRSFDVDEGSRRGTNEKEDGAHDSSSDNSSDDDPEAKGSNRGRGDAVKEKRNVARRGDAAPAASARLANFITPAKPVTKAGLSASFSSSSATAGSNSLFDIDFASPFASLRGSTSRSRAASVATKAKSSSRNVLLGTSAQKAGLAVVDDDISDFTQPTGGTGRVASASKPVKLACLRGPSSAGRAGPALDLSSELDDDVFSVSSSSATAASASAMHGATAANDGDNSDEGEDVATSSGTAGAKKQSVDWEFFSLLYLATPTLFLELCILAGCDFLPSLPSIGLKTASRLIQRHGSAEGAIRQVLQREQAKALALSYPALFHRARLAFYHHTVYDVERRCFTTLHPLPPALVFKFPCTCAGQGVSAAPHASTTTVPLPAADVVERYHRLALLTPEASLSGGVRPRPPWPLWTASTAESYDATQVSSADRLAYRMSFHFHKPGDGIVENIDLERLPAQHDPEAVNSEKGEELDDFCFVGPPLPDSFAELLAAGRMSTHTLRLHESLADEEAAAVARFRHRVADDSELQEAIQQLHRFSRLSAGITDAVRGIVDLHGRAAPFRRSVSSSSSSSLSYPSGGRNFRADVSVFRGAQPSPQKLSAQTADVWSLQVLSKPSQSFQPPSSSVGDSHRLPFHPDYAQRALLNERKQDVEAAAAARASRERAHNAKLNASNVAAAEALSAMELASLLGDDDGHDHGLDDDAAGETTCFEMKNADDELAIELGARAREEQMHESFLGVSSANCASTRHADGSGGAAAHPTVLFQEENDSAIWADVAGEAKSPSRPARVGSLEGLRRAGCEVSSIAEDPDIAVWVSLFESLQGIPHSDEIPLPFDGPEKRTTTVSSGAWIGYRQFSASPATGRTHDVIDYAGASLQVDGDAGNVQQDSSPPRLEPVTPAKAKTEADALTDSSSPADLRESLGGVFVRAMPKAQTRKHVTAPQSPASASSAGKDPSAAQPVAGAPRKREPASPARAVTRSPSSYDGSTGMLASPSKPSVASLFKAASAAASAGMTVGNAAASAANPFAVSSGPTRCGNMNGKPIPNVLTNAPLPANGLRLASNAGFGNVQLALNLTRIPKELVLKGATRMNAAAGVGNAVDTDDDMNSEVDVGNPFGKPSGAGKAGLWSKPLSGTALAEPPPKQILGTVAREDPLKQRPATTAGEARRSEGAATLFGGSESPVRATASGPKSSWERTSSRRARSFVD